ncbi:methyl-accepting chemotaxis protein [Thioalkalivibrio sulfidiphilus]|uniref:methyl-accepting chemotaxis protein n=1 Tax=Thioalkalivibrio sulfidiphilus TaxID=1033854 RepID=UPI0003AAC085|nr:PAS domain-containing methyl-accepting chemotaxis protein [Thioalkalivibrio sulfidiphilus]
MILNKRLHNELAECRQALAETRFAFDAIRASVAYIEFTPDGQILDVNEHFLAATGHTRDVVLGAHHRLFCEPSYVKSTEYRQFWERLARGESHAGTFPRRMADGRRLWLEATYFPVRDASGRVTRVIKIASDVTAKQEQLRDQAAVFQALDRSMAVISFTPEGQILDANRNFLDAVGYRLDEVRGRHHRMFCDEAFYRDHPHFWEQLAAGELMTGKFRRLRSDGRELWLEASYNPILDEQGRTVKVIKFATDITESVDAANKIRDASAVAYSTAQQTADNAGRGYTSLLASVENSEQIRALIEEAKRAIHDLNSQSKNIETIVATISSVASQTNLLALNAAIEAARAGEHGRGFAVVADEVRQLAARTSAATEEITRVLQGNLQYTTEIVTRIENVSEAAERGRQQVISAGTLVDEIRSGATHVVDLVSSIPRVA